MGTWGSGLYANDTTCDVKEIYMGLLMNEVEDMEAYKQTLERCADYIGSSEEPLFWYALAECQWRTGRLLPEVQKKALWWIEQDGGLKQWKESINKGAGWEKTLQRLKKRLETPMPVRKKIKPLEEVNSNLWELNDIYAYQFHLDSSDEEFFDGLHVLKRRNGYKGKYMVIQKIGEGKNTMGSGVAMRVQIFDKLFETLPTIKDLEGVRILPVDFPERVNISHDAPSRYSNITIKKEPIWMSALMPLYKKRDYPKKYLFYLGNQPGPSNKQDNRQELAWSNIENSLRLFYQLWDGIEYDTVEDGIYDYVQPNKVGEV